jgi:hypothetical protein
LIDQGQAFWSSLIGTARDLGAINAAAVAPAQALPADVVSEASRA